MDIKKVASGSNVLSTKNPSLEEMYEAACFIKDASNTKYVLANKIKPARSEDQRDAYSDPAFLPHTETWEERYFIEGEGEGKQYNINDFSRHKMLANLKIAPGFFDRAPSDLRYNALNRLAREAKNYATLTIVETDEFRAITGYVTSKSVPLYNHDILKYLAEWVQENGFQYKVEHAYMDINHMSFKIVLIDNSVDLSDDSAVSDAYNYGIAIQNSSTGYCETIINPMLFRVVCSNGLINVKDEKSLIKQQNLALPAEALRVVLGDVLDWMKSSEASEVLGLLKDLSKNGTKWNVKRIKALLPQVLLKVGADQANAFKKSLWDVWPENDETFAVPAYDVINVFTNRAQNFAPAVQAQIEQNVLKILTKAVADSKPKQ